MSAFARVETHEVFNQSPPFAGRDLFAADAPLRDAVTAFARAGEEASLSAFGQRWGSEELAEHARLANECPPRLRTFDSKGFRRDTVEFHPSYHALMRESVAAGLHASTWTRTGTLQAPPAEALRAARYYMVAQVENGHMCPITMTRASLGALAAAPDLRDRLLPKILASAYDDSFRPWQDKDGITLGMGMTEKQGGTDVRANTTRATPRGEGYAITGHKWFMSAPMCDAFLVLAHAPGGLTCFLTPRFRPDGDVNAIRIQRLKDKLGNRSNASSEVEFVDAFGWRVGEEGRGVRTIIDMVQLTRVDCIIGSAGQMRAAFVRALHHARHRTVFQRKLVDQPMMHAVLADMALELEGVVALTMRLCRAVDHAAGDAAEAAYARLLTPAIKYWVCKIAPALVYECLECMGGNGYVEEGDLARLYREAPLNAIWEGSGNVMGLDVLRALGRDRDSAYEVLGAMADEAAGLPGVEEAVASIRATAMEPDPERHARRLVEALARLAAAAAVRRSAPSGIADAYATMRLRDSRGSTYGVSGIPASVASSLLRRALADA